MRKSIIELTSGILIALVVCIVCGMSIPTKDTVVEVKLKYLIIQLDTVLGEPLTSRYWQTKAHAEGAVHLDRKGFAQFHKCPTIPTRWQAADDETYRSNGTYDKGHLSPYTAMDFDSTAARESMYYINTAPQVSSFNEHPWEQLEQYILHTMTKKYDSMLVITGCIYGTEALKGVSIPKYYWKAVVVGKQFYTWLAPNIPAPVGTKWQSYAIPPLALRDTISKYHPTLLKFLK